MHSHVFDTKENIMPEPLFAPTRPPHPVTPSRSIDTSSLPPCPAIWDWRYGLADSKIRTLYKKAVAEQWQADHLKWDYVIDPARNLIDPASMALVEVDYLRPLSKRQREQFMALNMADSLSQILHGEQGAMLVSCRLAQILPELDAKSFAVTQAVDEARHIDVFARYARRLHDVFPPTATLCRILDKVIATPHWQGTLIGMNIMVEGLALATFASLRSTTHCELLRELLKLVMRDESRHLAFGDKYLKSILLDMHPDDRAEVEDFAVDIVNEYRQWGCRPDDWSTIFSNLIQVGMDPVDYLAQLRINQAETGAAHIEPRMLRGLDSIVMPALKRLGLITDRVRSRYLAAELDSSRDTHTLEELERSLCT
jgi:rubrerythrin